MLVWPSDLPAPPHRIVGADAMHRQLVGWLELLGHRRDLRPGSREPVPTGLQTGSPAAGDAAGTRAPHAGTVPDDGGALSPPGPARPREEQIP
jgi:hypothetical protein